MRESDPVGAVEIAERLQVKRNTVDHWRRRGLGFPEPRWTVGGRPAWNWDDVSEWHEARLNGTREVADKQVLLARAKPLRRDDVTPNLKGSK